MASMSSFAAKLFQRMPRPTSPATTDTMIRPPNSSSEIGSPENAWTESTMPERVMNVPTTTKEKDRHAHMMLQRLKPPRWR